jgi:hypothetical protein
MKSRAQIANGRWKRRVTWCQRGCWRADMFKTVLNDERLQEAEFICRGGPHVIVPAADLRFVLPNLKDHYAEKIWGPFNIDPTNSTIDGYKVKMTVA